MRIAELTVIAALLASTLTSTAADWKPICSANDLDGWTSKPELNHWSAKDGVITGANTPEKRGSVLWSEAEFGEFTLEVDVRFSGIIDSGIFVKGKRYQVNLGISSSLKKDMTCSIYAPADKRGKYPGLAEGVAELWKKDDWNAVRIQAKGKHIIVTVNGTQALDYETVALEESGPIGLQVHAGHHMKVEFRNPRVKQAG